jgi:hypothetical protein
VCDSGFAPEECRPDHRLGGSPGATKKLAATDARANSIKDRNEDNDTKFTKPTKEEQQRKAFAMIVLELTTGKQGAQVGAILASYRAIRLRLGPRQYSASRYR